MSACPKVSAEDYGTTMIHLKNSINLKTQNHEKVFTYDYMCADGC